MAARFVVGFNPVPAANAVATQGSRLRRSLLWTLFGVALWSGLWFWRRGSVGSIAWLVAGYGVSVLWLLVQLVRLLLARRHLAMIGTGPALEAAPRGLRLHSLDGTVTELDWAQVRALTTAGRKFGVGPQMVVRTETGPVWRVPLSFLDALPGTIDGGVRACSAGRFGLDLRRLDALV